MYNLLVSANEDAWNGEPFVIERSRCVAAAEYTDGGIADRFADLDPKRIRELCSLPCVFAYETPCGKDPKFGALREVKARVGGVLWIDYAIMPCEPFATAADLRSERTALDVGEWELHRSHWAVKDVNLAQELGRLGIVLPEWATPRRKQVDVRRHRFQVALSFPGEHRDYVERVATELDRQLGANACFYDRFYQAQLAGPNLDVLLQGVYGDRSNLVVAFVCTEYDEKRWCGIEWRKIRERVATGDDIEVMYVRLGEGDVAGMTALDGYLDARTRAPEDVARLIVDRLAVAQDGGEA